MLAWCLALLAAVAAAADPAPEQRSPDLIARAQQHYLSGMLYFQKQDYGRARDEWSLCRTLDPGNADCAAGLERISGEFPAEQRHPFSAQQHYLSGMIFYQKGDYASAKAEWKVCTRLEPSNKDCAGGLDRIERFWGDDPPHAKSDDAARPAVAPPPPPPDLEQFKTDWKAALEDARRQLEPACEKVELNDPKCAKGERRHRSLGSLDKDSSK